MQPVGIHHVAICMPDIEAGIDFYCRVLGFTIAARPPNLGDGVWLQGGGGQVHLMKVAHDIPKLQHYAIQVEDLEAAVADIRAAGGEVRTLDGPIGSGRQAFMHDPAGNFIELNQPDVPAASV